MDGLIQIMRREAMGVVRQFQQGSGTLVATAYNPKTFTAKSQSFTADNIAIKGTVALDGDLSSSGKVAGLGGVTSGGQPVRTV